MKCSSTKKERGSRPDPFLIIFVTISLIIFIII